MIETHDHEGLREIRMARAPVNALDPGLVDALRHALAEAVRDDVRGVVLAGAPGIFSAGLDLKHLLALDRGALDRFWRDFFGLLEDLARLPVPVVAAITGHSPAGGAVMALFCDYRIAAAGEFRLGLNEVQVGLVVPAPIQAALIRLVGGGKAERLLVSGALLTPDEAFGHGLVDEVVPPEETIERALGWLGSITALPAHAMLKTREMVRAPLAEAFRSVSDSGFARLVDDWLDPGTQETLKAVLARLSAGKKTQGRRNRT